MEIKPSVSNKVYDENGKEFKSIRQLAKYLNVGKDNIIRKFKNGEAYKYNGHTYLLYTMLKDDDATKPVYATDTTASTISHLEEYNKLEEIINSSDYKEFIESKNVSELPFEKYDFDVTTKKGHSKYAIALFSDAHIEETVDQCTVLGLNEYNIEIAEERIKKYFVNLVNALNEDDVENLVFASLGDMISSFIHEELMETNSLTPIEATFKAQNLLYNGLQYIVKNSNVKHIKFIGIVGNHSRTTKKIQHSNGYAMSYEWLMYKNVEKVCMLTNLPIEFEIPKSEMAVLQILDKKFIFIHGFQIKGGNGISGILPSLNKMTLKWERIFHQDKVYLGHFHNFMSLTNIGVNGSIIGYNTFSLTNAMLYEKPLQLYDLYNDNGLILTRKIYCE